MRQGERITINEVAAKAGVSAATVSRVFNNRGMVAPETARRVQEAIRELGYDPSPFARGLRRQSTNIIGILLQRSESSIYADLYFSDIIRGVGEVAELEDHNLLIATPFGVNKGSNWPGRFAHLLEGLIIAGTSPAAEWELERAMAEFPSPIVAVGWHVPNLDVPRVVVDNHRVGLLAGRALFERGLSRIAVLSAPLRGYVGKERLLGLQAAAREFGIRDSELLVREVGSLTNDSGYSAVKEILENHRDIEGIVVANSALTLGAIKYVQDSGVEIPAELYMVGSGSSGVAQIANSPVALVHTDAVRMGRLAMQLFLEERRERSPSPKVTVTISPELHIPKAWNNGK